MYIAPDNTVLDDAHAVPKWVKVSPFVAMLLGFVVAYWFYIVNTSLPARLAANQRPLYLFLLNKWYFDELFDFLFVRPAYRIGRFLWKKGDGATIDGLGPDGVSATVLALGRRVRQIQSGYVYHYAFAMLIGVALVVTWFMVGGGGF